MNCTTCHAENPDRAKFCVECGSAFASRCASCSAELPAGAKFCAECGTKIGGAKPAPAPAPRETPKHLADKIRQSKSAVEGERKQVTVLFADVKGSMELAESLDPEAFSKIMSRFFAILTEGVERFEGFVDKFTGDGIMALFGAPIAHEDHAQRACYAALHLRDRARQYADELRVSSGINFSVRIGLNSGEVVVGSISDDLRMDYTAQGHTVGLAQRMEGIAPADGIAISHNTQKPVDGYFITRTLGPLKVKGAREPIEVFVLEGVGNRRTRLDASRARGLSRFVGRGDEMAALETALSQSLKGTGRVAAVVGEPGVGKSRICAEFIERCRSRGIAVYEAHCPAHGKTIPYLPLLELLRNLFGITDQDGPREARQKIAGELALLDDGFADDRALVLDFLGVGDPKAPALQLEPAVLQRRLFAFLRRLLQLRTQAESIVLLIDDLHWIDPGSDLFVAQIVEAVSATHTLMLVNFRPEYQADWLRKSWVLQLPMTPLGSEALADLVRDWVGTGPTVAKLPALIGARSGGNPFFSEEIVLSLLETGCLVGSRGAYELVRPLDALEVPATVQSLLAARIDRLGEREKQALYAAAVIGKEFSRPLLEAVIAVKGFDLDSALAGLLAAEIIHERAIYPVAEYAFKHPLTHEVALHAQLTAPKQARHKAAALAIEAAEPKRLDELAGMLAHHWSEAGEGLRAATWYIRAARWVRNSDLSASQRNWQAARNLLLPLPVSSERAQLLLEVYPELINLMDRLGGTPVASQSLFQEGVDFARSASDSRTESLLEAAYAWLNTGKNDWPLANKHAERAINLSDGESHRPVQLFARFVLGRAHLWLGNTQKSLMVFDQAKVIGSTDDADDIELLGWRPYIEAMSVRAVVHTFAGRHAESLEFAARVPSLVKRFGAHSDISQIIADRIWTYVQVGDADRARQCGRDTLQMAERFGSDRNIIYGWLVSGLASMLALRWHEGNEFFTRGRQRIESSGTGVEWGLQMDGPHAVCLAGIGHRQEALAMASRGVESARAANLPAAVGLMGVYRARVRRMLGETEPRHELDMQVSETLAPLEKMEWHGVIPNLLLERAGIAKLRGDTDGMKRDLAEVRRLYTKLGVTGWDDYARSIEA